MLRNNVSIVDYQQNNLILAEKIKLPDNFLELLKKASNKIYNSDWKIIISNQEHQNTDSLEEQAEKIINDKIKNFATSTEICQNKVFLRQR